MKKLILSICIFYSFVATAQTPAGYTNINARYKWVAGMFDSALHVPRYNGTPSGLRTGAATQDGSIAIDTTNDRMYIYSSGVWYRLAKYNELSNISEDSVWKVGGNTFTDDAIRLFGSKSQTPFAFITNDSVRFRIGEFGIERGGAAIQKNILIDTVTRQLYYGESAGTATWGAITGTLSAQTDLQTALNAKLNISDTATMLGGYTRLQRFLDSLTAHWAAIQLRATQSALVDTAAAIDSRQTLQRVLNNGSTLTSENNITNTNIFTINGVSGGYQPLFYYSLLGNKFISGNSDLTNSAGFFSLSSADSVFGTLSKNYSSSIYSLTGTNKYTYLWADSNDIKINGDNIYFRTGGTNRWQISANGRLVRSSGNTMYIGGGNESASGVRNTGVGTNSLLSLTSGLENTAFGTDALYSVNTGSYNVAVGVYPLYFTTSGSYNVAVGLSAMTYNTTSSYSTAIGFQSMRGIGRPTFQNQSVAVGYQSLFSGADSTTAIGYQSGSGTLGGRNIFLGHLSGSSVTTGSGNVIIGSNNGSSIGLKSNHAIISDGSGNIKLSIDSIGGIKFNSYGTGSKTGTAAYTLQVDASGNVIEGSVGGGGGSPAGNYGNLQINRNGSFATPTSDSLGYTTSGGLVVKANGTNALQVQGGALHFPTNNDITWGSGSYLTEDGSGNIYFQGAGTMNLFGSNANVGVSVRSVGTAVFSGGSSANASSMLHVTAANTTSLAQMKLATGGSVLTTPEAGAIESTNTHIYWTDNSGTRIQLDNDAGGITESSYTPTLTNTTNIGASTAYSSYYVQSGNWVHVWGTVDIDATTALTVSEMGFSLPVASDVTDIFDIGGTASFEDNTTIQIKGDAANDRAMFRFTPQTATNNKYSFHFTYKVTPP